MDLSQYLNMFLEEASEHLQKLNELLLSLESSPDSRDILDDIFRSAHTLKGMSATMGFTRVAELTHEMENVLHKLRNGDILTTPNILDVLFQCVDSLENMVGDIAGGGTGERSIDHLVYTLRSCHSQVDERTTLPASSEEEKGSEKDVFSQSDIKIQAENQFTHLSFNEYEKNLIKQAIGQGFNCYHLVIHIDPSCVMKSARAFMIFKNLEAIGEIFKTNPSTNDIEEERFETSFELFLITSETESVVSKKVTGITEVEEPDIWPIQELNLTAAETSFPMAVISHDNGAAANSRLKSSQTIRVDAVRLDSLMNLVGELVINKTRLEQIGRVAQLTELNETLEQIDKITSDLQNVVMKVRMVPIDNVFSRFPRMVRDLAKDLGKEVELIIEGKETELDRTVIDEIGDPLVHLLRNSVDHGLEEPTQRLADGKSEYGRVVLSARHEGNNVIIEVQDDGRGLCAETIKNKAVEKGLVKAEEAAVLDENSLYRLIVLPGFSTAKEVTDISGRGVGLDVVKNKIESLNGTLHIESTLGQGTRFKIRLPLTIAIIQALLVSLENEVYAIPLSFIAETTSLMPDELKKIHEQQVALLRGEVLPLIKLHEVLQVPPAEIPKEQEINIVVVRKGDKKVGLIVDTLIGQQEIVIKPLGKLMGSIPYVAGATILGNGQVSLIIDVASLF